MTLFTIPLSSRLHVITYYLAIYLHSLLIVDRTPSFHHSFYIIPFLSTKDPYMLQKPYTTTLSLLRKIDLIWLSIELKLPTDGNVMNLGDRLRVYLNAHSEVLWRNPWFRPLYPQHRRTTQPVVQQAPELANREPSPTPLSSSNLSSQSFESWYGNEELPAQLPIHPQCHVPYFAPTLLRRLRRFGSRCHAVTILRHTLIPDTP